MFAGNVINFSPLFILKLRNPHKSKPHFQSTFPPLTAHKGLGEIFSFPGSRKKILNPPYCTPILPSSIHIRNKIWNHRFTLRSPSSKYTRKTKTRSHSALNKSLRPKLPPPNWLPIKALETTKITKLGLLPLHSLFFNRRFTTWKSKKQIHGFSSQETISVRWT